MHSVLHYLTFKACIAIMSLKTPDPFLKTISYLKTRTLLDPLFRLNRSVAVQIRTQVAVPYNPPDRKVLHQHPHQHCHRVFLPVGTRVGRFSVFIQPAFIGNADAASVMSLGMRSHTFHRTHGANAPVGADIIMVAAALEPSLPVHLRQQSHESGLSALVAVQ